MAIKRISEDNWVVIVNCSVFSGPTKAEAIAKWRESLEF